MSISTIIGKLLAKDSQARAAADSDYRELVRDCANDRTVTESKITATLTASGKSLADLERDISAEQERVRNLSVAARRDEIMAALSENNAGRVEADRDYAASVAQLLHDHGQRVAELTARDRELSDELRRVEAAERRLLSDGPDRLDEIDAELRRIADHERTWASITRRGSTRPIQANSHADRERKSIDQRRAELHAERDRIRTDVLSAN